MQLEIDIISKFNLKYFHCDFRYKATVSSARDKTTINFKYIYHIALWLLENSTTLQAPNK